MTLIEDHDRQIEGRDDEGTQTMVLHEPWCAVFDGRGCDCYPIIHKGRRSWPEDG